MGGYRYVPLKDSVPLGAPVEIETADDDEDTIEIVRLAMERTDCELWRGQQRVAIVPRDRRPVVRLG
jgi:hypothetical protein